MAFASRCGLDITSRCRCRGRRSRAVRRGTGRRRAGAAAMSRSGRSSRKQQDDRAGVRADVGKLPSAQRTDRDRACQGTARCSDESRASTCSARGRRRRMRMQRMRDNPDCAQQEYARILDERRSRALSPRLTFDPDAGCSRAFHRHWRAAQGSRSCASRASTARWKWRPPSTAPASTPYDVHMSDMGRAPLAGRFFKGFVACGGFSYGDVLGAGEGWAKSILFNASGCATSSRLSSRVAIQVRARRVQRLPDDEQPARAGAGHGALAAFRAQCVGAVRGASRDGGVCNDSPSLFFAGMEGSRIPVATAHGEGYRGVCTTPRNSPLRSRWWRCASSIIAALRPRLSVQCQRLAAGHHRTDHEGRPLHDPDAASGAGASLRADVVASWRGGATRRHGCGCSATRAYGRLAVALRAVHR